MGQVINKLASKGDPKQQAEKQKEELSQAISKFLDDRYPDFDTKAKDWKENEFIHVIYETVERISEKSGAMQFRLPKIEKLRETFNEVHLNEKMPLNKEEFKKIVEKILKLEYFYVGQGAKDVFLYIFGVPIVALFAKRIIPGPTASISDDVFIPAVTSGTVYYLARRNML